MTAARGLLRARTSRAVASALVAVALLLPTPAGVARAADVTFGVPQETAAYGTSVEFTVPITTDVALERIELRLGFPGAIGPVIVDVPKPTSGGTQTLRYLLDLSGGGHVYPNTPISATWAAVPTDGATVTSPASTILYADTAHDWRTIKGDIVTVHWYEGDRSFAERELRLGEGAIRDASELLGVTETEPVDFFIYADQPSFVKALGPRTGETQIGAALANLRTLYALIAPDTADDPVVGDTVPHELVHLVFDTTVHNPYRRPPLWLNEGLAVYLSEQGYSAGRRSCLEETIASNDLMPLAALGGEFPADPVKGYSAYCEAVSAIDYLVRVDGRDALVALVRGYRDGLTDDEAFTRALGRDFTAFQEGWLGELGVDLPERYGPQPAPAGPLPEGWTGPGQTAAPGATPGAATGAPAGTPEARPGPGSGPAPASDDGAGPLVLAVVVAGFAVATGLLVARRRSRAS